MEFSVTGSSKKKKPIDNIFVVRQEGSRLILQLMQDLSLSNSGYFYQKVSDYIGQKGIERIDLIMDRCSRIDSAGLAALSQSKIYARKNGVNLRVTRLTPAVKGSIKTFSTRVLTHEPIKGTLNPFEILGGSFYYWWDLFVEYLYHMVDTFFAAFWGLFSNKGRRKGSIVQQTVLIGVDAFPIIALMSFLIGFVLALQSAAQLRQFGANIFVAHLIAISMTREMGPIMTAIILAGRSGSSFASEVATMKVTEELDALKVMGLKAVDYVVVPKFYGITISAPLLTIMADVIGIFGGFVIANLYLNLNLTVFFNEVVKVLFLKDIITSMIKSVVFAWLIVTIGTFYGLQASGGPEGVGKVTTNSVVASIFMVVVWDSILGILFYF